MTAKTKIVNYSAEQTAAMVADYTASPTPATVEALAMKMGKSLRSVVAKLSREGVYQKAERLTKTGEKVVKKDATADEIGKIVGMTVAEVDSLTKANKTALAKILAVVKAAAKLNDEPEAGEVG